MSEATDSAVEGEGKESAVALVIAILALLLALAEAGAKNAQHCRRKKYRILRPLQFLPGQTNSLDGRRDGRSHAGAQKSAVTDPKAPRGVREADRRLQSDPGAYEKDPKKPEDSMDAIQDRAKEASELGNWPTAGSDIMSL